MDKIIFLFLVLGSFLGRSLALRCEVVSVLYGNDFKIGVRTLGQSLKETNPHLSKTLLVTEDVWPSTIEELREIGWNIKKVPKIANPHAHSKGARKRLDYVFTKLAIWELTEFDRVIYLDGDTLVTESIDELCNCNARVCAVTRDVYFNAGVMVITPSELLHADLINAYKTSLSYNQGEQGFLNLVFPEFQRCLYFEPQVDSNFGAESTRFRFSKESISSFVSHVDTMERCRRLPAFYNGDFGLYVVRGDRWEVDPVFNRTHPKIIHYTMGPVKPWDWMSYVLGGEAFQEWFAVYQRSLSDSEERRIISLHGFVMLVMLGIAVFAGLLEKCGLCYRLDEVDKYPPFIVLNFTMFAVCVLTFVGIDILSRVAFVYPLITVIELWTFFIIISFSFMRAIGAARSDKDIVSFMKMVVFMQTPCVISVFFIAFYFTFLGAVMRVTVLGFAVVAVVATNSLFSFVRMRRYFLSQIEDSPIKEAI